MGAPVAVDRAHNIPALFIGTGEFSFAKGATSVLNALQVGFRDFGNMVAVTPNVDSQREEHFGSYRGVRRKDKTQATQSKVEYTMRFDELSLNILKAAFGASDGTDYVQSAITTQAADVWSFQTTPSDYRVWYDVKKSGIRVRGLTDIVIATSTPATLVQGTDYEVDVKLGAVRFLTAQTLACTATISAPAITAASALFQEGLIPLQDLNAAGFGHLVLFDQNDTTKVAVEHVDFSCVPRRHNV
jgi:hypothetical protein